MAEGGVDHRRVRNREYQLLDADAGQQLVLGEQPVVGGEIQFEDRLEVRVIIGDRHEHAVAAGQMPGRPPGGVYRAGGPAPAAAPRHQPARRASSSRRTVCIAGRPPRIM